MERFTEKEIWCLRCGKYHAYDMSLKQVACPKEHPLDYTDTSKNVGETR